MYFLNSNFVPKNNENLSKNVVNLDSKLFIKEISLKNNIKKPKEEINIIQSKDEKIKNEINNYIKKIKERKNELLKYTLTHFLVSIFCCEKIHPKKLIKKEDTFKKIVKKINSYIEITNLMRLYENFEKMKFILFNKNQIDCFDYMIYDVNFNNNIKETEILYELTKYFKNNKNNILKRNIDESIKIILKNEIKKLIINE